MAGPRILHVAAEAHPLVKTGGLADVAAALPAALRAAGCDARLLLPGYPAVLAGLAAAGGATRAVATLAGLFGAGRVDLVLGRLPAADGTAGALPVYAIDAPWLYRRDGNPYVDASGRGWPDNAQRFALLGWTAAQLAAGGLDPDWEPALVHAHDWHAALAPAYLRLHPARRVPTVYTVHNLAFQGRFPLAVAPSLGLPPELLTPAALEFHGDLSFMKAGLTQADAITTVSPTYAREIRTAAFGEGLDGVLRARAAALVGIRNGIDDVAWNPAADPALAAPFDAAHPSARAKNAVALRRELGLDAAGASPLVAMVGRLTEQKGVDLLLGALDDGLLRRTQLVVLGSGEPRFEQALAGLASAHPGRVAVRIGFDEALAHRIMAAADLLVVPSRFEPCGLTQMYAMRYGAVPLVRRVGGLADTVVDGDGDDATGFVFDAATPDALREALERALAARAGGTRWRARIDRGMRSDFGWREPARRYVELYRSLGAGFGT